MRFRKRIQICKGVKLNLSTSGVSATVGGKGLSLNLGKQGLFLNTSIPGTGLYDRKKLVGSDKMPFGKKKNDKKTSSREQSIALPSFSLVTEENGEVKVVNAETGREITSAATLKKIRATEQYQEEYAAAMDKIQDSINAETESFVEIARCTAPLKTDWEDRAEYASPAYMEETIEAWLAELDLPVEFELDFEYDEAGQCMMVDLDLPEIEDIPDTKAVELADGSVKERQKSLKDVRNDYVKCVFGMAVFFAGNILNVSPYIEQVLVSGYTQRRSRKGDLEDQYVYSVLFRREGFARVDYQKLEPVDFCMKFKNRCNISAAGEMKQIEPYEIADCV